MIIANSENTSLSAQHVTPSWTRHSQPDMSLSPRHVALSPSHHCQLDMSVHHVALNLNTSLSSQHVAVNPTRQLDTSLSVYDAVNTETHLALVEFLQWPLNREETGWCFILSPTHTHIHTSIYFTSAVWAGPTAIKVLSCALFKGKKILSLC